MISLFKTEPDKMTLEVKVPNSWKTSLVGLAGAVLAVIQGAQIHDWTLAVKDHGVQMAIAIAVLGFFSKDSNVTGGTKGQPSTLEALQDAAPLAEEKK